MNLEEIKSQAKKEIEAVKEIKDLENWRIKYLGRKSDLSLFFDNLKKIPLDQRKKEAQQAHNIRLFLIDLFKSKEKDFLEREENNEYLDLSQPGIKKEIGHLHPISLVLEEIVEIFRSLGFEVIEGPEIETEYYNFDALRIPETHPARDMWDTLWITSKMLLRTHTSPMQIRYMEKHQPPFRIIVPGKTFRHEATDASHEIQFHQVEGLMVSKNINFSNFKFIIEEFLKAIFKNNILIRFRPSYFPFVTPGVEVDIKIRPKFQEQKSKVNQNEWLEIMGAGMVHPDLYKIVGYKEKNLQGFAFGLGVERIAMIKYKISDIRLFTSSDIRFLKQM